MTSLQDSKSSVEILEVFGSDLTVVNAARVSFAKESHEMTNQDEKLIRYLAKHNHNSPFFHPQIRMRLKMPIFVAREWFRHTIGFARNEVSRRYVDSAPEFFHPEGLRARDKNLKQGSKQDFVEQNEELMKRMDEWNKTALDFYYLLLENNVCPEQARMILPQSMMTLVYETDSLAGLARACKLRLDPSAQKEIRDMAQQISDKMAEHFPISWSALSATASTASTAVTATPST